ncbi:hypothetical protein Bbelb_413740, partial [Branchiostoma belcheri]
FCQPGFFCLGGANTSTPQDGVTGDICPAGSHCPEGSPEHYSCNNGTYMNHTMAEECYDCPEGYYCVNGDRADPCPPGYYCPARTGADLQLCPAGTYNPRTLLSSVDQCTDCDPGKYCQLPGRDSYTGPCAAGYYCESGVNLDKPTGNHTGHGAICPAGHYCPEGSAAPLGCPAGQYTELEGQGSCSQCEPGYYCPDNSTSYTDTLCPTGHYCPGGTTSAYENPCPRGSYNPVNGSDSADDCLPCPAGQYCVTDGQEQPTGNCSAGWYCTGGSYLDKPLPHSNATDLSECTCPLVNYTGGKCWPGTYCPSGSPYPVSCDEGSYCMGYGRETPNGPCDAGYYCDGGMSEPNPADRVCVPGHFCVQGSATPQPCPAGTFSNMSGNTEEDNCSPCTPGYYCEGLANVNATELCSAGYYCPAGQKTSTPDQYNCTRGHFCPEGSPDPEPCQAGQYQDEEGADDCKNCPPGRYCDPVEAAALYGVLSHGVITPVDCPAGYYCLQNTASRHQHPCPDGYYSNTTNLEQEDQCLPCPGGTYCDAPGLTEYTALCDAGYVCVSASNTSQPEDGTTGYICPEGSYCPTGSHQETKCPQGSFSNRTGLHNVSECAACTPGYHCLTQGLTEPTDECAAGHYCSLAAITPNPVLQSYGDYCTPGHYCPQGTGEPVPCPRGTFLPDTGMDELTDCLNCTGGKYCERQGQSNVTDDCEAGFYCSSGAWTATPTDGGTGDVCPAGHFCPTGSAQPVPCDDGTYMNHSQAEVCDTCPAGYYCVRGHVADPCPAGHYCPNGTGFDWKNCPKGTYGPVEMLAAASECTQCDGGRFCSESGATNVTGMCAPGYFCQWGVDTATPNGNHTGVGGECPEGSYCPEGTPDPIGCEAGTYNDRTLQANCTACPPGYYCPVNSTTYVDTPCWTGFYCLEGTASPTQYPCPAGTYNNRTHADSAFDCLPCPGGLYCAGDGLSTPTGDCAPGWYCSGGAFSDKPSPYVNTSDSYSVDTECPVYSLNFTGGICTPGTYCPEGSQRPTPCDLGQYCEQHALDATSGPCSAGFFCNGSAEVRDPQPCSTGHYCPEGTDMEMPCPAGTYADQEGNANISECTPCTPGSYCSDWGMDSPSAPCAVGYYCPGGQNTSQPMDLACSPGHFCLQGSWNQTGCPSGYYQPHWGRGTCDVCEEGFYCQAYGDYEVLDYDNTTSSGNFSSRYRSLRGVSVPAVCPPGSYCPAGTKFASQFLCPEGTYSNRSGLANHTQCTPCDPGMFCQGQGNTEPTDNCTAGYFCTLGAWNSTPTDGNTGDICPEGRFCPSGSVVGAGCPKGTFSNMTGLTEASECRACTPGHYCADTGLTQESGQCWAGHYCLEGSDQATPVGETFGDECTAGHYCPNGTDTPVACPPGTFLPTRAMEKLADCVDCSSGYYCETPGQTNVTAECAAGFYCQQAANTSTPTDGVTGDICPEGHYCELGSPSPVPCGNGTFMNHTGASACYVCPAGYYCVNRDRADNCTQGYYCPEGTGADLWPCPAGFYGGTPGLRQEADCTECAGGSYCSTPGLPAPEADCAAGHFCIEGVDTATPNGLNNTGVGGICPPGYYCPTGTAAPRACEAGTFNYQEGRASCDPCPAGYFCYLNTSDPYANICPTGHYCPAGTEYGERYPCLAGTYNPLEGQQNSSACVLCDPGQYCQGDGLSQPTGNCSAGWYCTGGASEAQPLPPGNVTACDLPANYSDVSMCSCSEIAYTGNRCPPGHYCPEGSTAPRKCDGGWYCQGYELSTPTAECAAGYYCPVGVGVTVPDPAEFPCTPGHYCEQGSPVQTACPNGTFSNTSKNTQLSNCLLCTPGSYCSGEGLVTPSGPCAPGFYCPAGQITDTPAQYTCPAGFYCPEGSATPEICDRGTYQSHPGQALCEVCPSGSYCDPHELNNVTGVITPEPCVPGHYCPNGTEYSTQNKCPAGTYSNRTSLSSTAECAACPPGMYCLDAGLTSPTGNCTAGFYCSGGADSPTPANRPSGDICPQGQYCPEGSEIGTDCPVGSYGNQTGLRDSTDCPLCDPGYYCDRPGLTAPYQPCHAGFYCAVGSTSPNPMLCPSGAYCPEGTPDPVPCPAGTFQPTEARGKTNSSACVDCTPGYYCQEGGQPNVTGECLPGYYCIRGASVQNPSDGTTGDICPRGFYCPAQSYWPTPCANGTYANDTGASECMVCPAGYYCSGGSTADNCVQGFYCPPGTGTDLQPCPAGTFGARTNLETESDCTPCSGGKFCDTDGLDDVAGNCDPGYYCTSGVNVSTPEGINTGVGGKCPPGHQCPQASANPQECAAGKYASQGGLAECDPCPPGFYCVNQTVTPVECPPGHYCPEGTEFDQQYPCPAGTYNNKTGQHNVSDCPACPPGMFCEGLGLVQPSGWCDEGFYCSGASSSHRPFDVGVTVTLSPTAAPITNYGNDTCHPLYDCVCPDNAMTTGGLCGPGYYCPYGSPTALPCDGGMYCETPGLTAPTGPCHAGFYCNHTSDRPDQHVCPAGHYCPTNTTVPVPCPAGTYSRTAGNDGLSDCLNCTAGFFCEGDGNADVDGPCGEGYYCPSGQATSTPPDFLCPRGHYCQQGFPEPVLCPNGTYQAQQGQRDCDVCPAGYYCDPNNGVAVVTPDPCPQGYYCPPGTPLSTSFPCPPGTYGATMNLTQESDCAQCTAGSYCETPGLSVPTAECYAGYYCTGGASSPTPLKDGVDASNNVTFTGNDECPIGHFCPNGTAYPQDCPAGTFSNNKGVTGEEGCEPCERGRYCSQLGFVNIDAAPPCDEGFVCTGGSTTPRPTDPAMGYICPAGFYCPAGTLYELGCEFGYYNPNPGQANCTVCPVGYMCDQVNMTSPEPCKSGHYCPEGVPSPVPCPEGTYNNKSGLSTESECDDCLAGYYCAGPGNSFPTGTLRDTTGAASVSECHPCTAGSYCNSSGLSAASGLCHAGYYCPSNHSTYSPAPSDLECPPGFFCPEGSAEPEPCPVGEYQPASGTDYCIPCRAGYYCQSAINPTPQLCPAFHYCPAGTMDPIPCHNGTYTNATTEGLKAEDECLPCPTGFFCRGGQLVGTCAAGYFCLAGSDDYTPEGDPPPADPDQDPCTPGDVCAGPCPGGHYCTEGEQDPWPCPENTLRQTPGASQLSDCEPCPAGLWCREGDPTAYLCPVGYYCDSVNGTSPGEGAGPKECPVHTYRDVPGARHVGECFNCPPGSWCNVTGMSDHTQSPCPVGHYCLEASDPEPCPAGQMRNVTGSGAPEECPLCRPGYYCPAGIPNVNGFPCAPHFECPEGAVNETICRPGHYCPGVTGTPPICPGGYYCPEGSNNYTICEYPSYCPEGSDQQWPCDLGWMPVNVTGLRDELSKACLICPVGTYRNDSAWDYCEPCPGGYYCPEGTDQYLTNPCPIGYYCPNGTGEPIPCRPGSYGNINLAYDYGQCFECPVNTFNHLFGQKACFPCGSSATAAKGSSHCECIGKYRAFQESDGSCICEPGYVYYNEANLMVTEGNSDADCQSRVDVRCDLDQVRLAGTRTCVYPSQYDCTPTCGDRGGSLSIELGVCLCESYVVPEEICDSTCVQTKPVVTAGLTSTGQLQMTTVDPTSGQTTTAAVPNCIGPNQHTSGNKPVHWVVVGSSGVYGVLNTETTHSDYLTTSGAGTPTARRRRSAPDVESPYFARRLLMSTALPNTTVWTTTDVPVTTSSLLNNVPLIPNPLLCLEVEEMVIFKVEVNETDRTKSHYPRYQKDHLFNTNPSFDYGAFRQLQEYIEKTNVTVEQFAFVFTDPGQYAFYDAQEPGREIFVSVKANGSSCEDGVVRIQPATENNLVSAGVKKTAPRNQEPDWGLIIGIIAFLGACVIMLVVAVIVWRPKHAGIYPMNYWRPKYRSLGAPPAIAYSPSYHDKGDLLLGVRGVAEGAESTTTTAMFMGPGEEQELENFNVRTLYDKLEDQNLHISAQLAKAQEDLRGFYQRIHDQNEGLKGMLNDLDLHRLEQLEKERQRHGDGREDESLQQSAGVPILNRQYNIQGPARKITLAGGGANLREQELMLALQILLDRMNSGNIPISKEMVEEAQRRLGMAGQPVPSGGWKVQGQGDLLRHQNAERLQLERELQQDEKDTMEKLLQEQEAKRQRTLQQLSEKLTFQLQGDLTEEEINRIMANHERELGAAMLAWEESKGKQAAELREQLARRRRDKEAALRKLHASQCQQAGIPAAPESKDNTEDKLHQQELVLDALMAEENAGLARAQMDHSSELEAERQQKMSDNINSALDDLIQQGALSEEESERIQKQLIDREAVLKASMEKRKNLQVSLMRGRMADRKRRRIQELKDRQVQEREAKMHPAEDEEDTDSVTKTKLSDGDHQSTIQDTVSARFEAARKQGRKRGRKDQDDGSGKRQRLLEAGEDVAELDRRHARELEALEAQIAAEEAEHLRDISRSLDEEHSNTLKESQKDVLKDLSSKHGVDAVRQQEIMDRFRKDQENLEYMSNIRRERQTQDLQAKLAARKARKIADAMRQAEEDAAKRFIDEQDKQLQQVAQLQQQEAVADLVIPQLKPGDSLEEQAIKKEHQRAQDELVTRHKDEREELEAKMDQEMRKKEAEERKKFEAEREKALREKKNKQAAELAARKDLTEEEMAALLAAHEQELEDLNDRLDAERSRQQLSLRDKLLARKRSRLQNKQRQQEAEMTKELLEQNKELKEARTKQVKEAEKQAMIDGIQQNGTEAGDRVIRAVLERRHAQELKDLEEEYGLEKKVMIDDALSRLHARCGSERDLLQQRHEAELEELENSGVTPEELAQLRAEMLNRQQLELSSLDRRHSQEARQLEQSALSDWELRFAQAKLALKEKHYKEFAQALMELTPDELEGKQRSVEQTLAAARELEEVRNRLEQQRKENEEKLKKEKEAFEKEEEERIRAELAAYEHQLEEEARQEKERTDKSIAALNKRKEDLLKEKKQKVKEEMERVAQQGVSEDEQRRLLEQHEKDVQKLEQKMEADRMRMQSGLQERLRRRREEKRRQKEVEVQNTAEEMRREHEEKLRSEEERMKKDEVLTLKESVNIDRLVPSQEDVSPAAVLTGAAPAQLALPGSFQQTAPLQDGELTNILMASPLYQKLQEIKDLIGNNSKLAAVGDGYMDSRDVDWGADTEFKPVDLNKLSPKDFIVYKFACFIGSLLTVHCGHPPVTILLADSIPPNPQLSKNAYRNSFQYDHNNRILYVRRARMDRVGEFVLVLVHTLAHIKSGDLRDDSSPDFVQEFHRALSAVCNDLFFARRWWETMFNDCETESERDAAVDDLLDVKLLRGTSREGVHFSKGELNTSWAGLLGGVDDKMQSAKDHGSKDQVDKWLGQLQKDSLTGAKIIIENYFTVRENECSDSAGLTSFLTLLTLLPGAGHTVRAGLSGLALWKATAKDAIQEDSPGGRMKVAIRKATEKDLLKQFLQVQVQELEERVDSLSGEYSQLCRQAVELQTSMAELQEETAQQTSLLQQAADGSARSQQMGLIKETVKKLNEARSSLTAANMSKAAVGEQLEALQTQLDDKPSSCRHTCRRQLLKLEL